MEKTSKATQSPLRDMDQTHLVSIIVPVYNAARFLEDTIKTIQDQSYKNWEAIFVDDCSTDNSVEIIKRSRVKDSRIKLFNNVVNSNAAITRNKGIRESRGRYIAFLDADDLWLPIKLEKQVAFMQQMQCTFSYTGYEFADEYGQPNGKRVRVPGSINYKKALKNTIIWTTTVMIDMNDMTKDQVYMPNVKSEDTATWWRLLKVINTAYGIDDQLSYYRRSSGTLSSNKLAAIKRVWNLYRNEEKLGLVPSAYCFSGYAYNTVRKRL